jgi:hypothetical protein
MSTGLDNWGFYDFSQVLFMIIITFLILWNAFIYTGPLLKYITENNNDINYGIILIIMMMMISIILVTMVLNQVLSIYQAYKVAENSQNICGIEYTEAISGRYKLFEAFTTPDESVFKALIYLVFSSSLALLVLNTFPFLWNFAGDLWTKLSTGNTPPGRDNIKSGLITGAILYSVGHFCYTLASLSLGFFNMKYQGLTDVKSTNRTNIDVFMIALMLELALLCGNSYLVDGNPFSSTNVLFAFISIILLFIYFVISDSFQTIEKTITTYKTMLENNSPPGLNNKVTELRKKLQSTPAFKKLKTVLDSMLVKNIRYYSAAPIPGSDDYILSQDKYKNNLGLYILHQNWKELHEIYDKLSK